MTYLHSTTHFQPSFRPRRTNRGTALAVFFSLVEPLLVWEQRLCQRRQLAAMDDRLLQDMGISRADALVEAEKPFWRA